MFASKSNIYISHENYLKDEEISPVRHEYVRGEVFAMAGGTQAHNTIAIALHLPNLITQHIHISPIQFLRYIMPNQPCYN